MCKGQGLERTQIFLPGGRIKRYQGGTLVDGNCHCYQLIGGHTFVVLGEGGDPDISPPYRIDGETLTFDAVMPDRCSSATCRNEFAYAVGTYTVGSWHRVDS